MTATSAGFGLRPVYHPSGIIRARAYPDGIASTYGYGILKYQPVTLDTSTGIVIAALGNYDWLGVFAGCEYTKTDGKRVYSNQWPAAGTYVAGTMIAYVWDDPAIVYEVQADDTVAQTAIGDQADFVSITAGSTTTGLSAALLDATVKTAGSQGQMRIEGLAPYQDNAWGDAYPILYVTNARHQYVYNKVAI